MGGLAVDPVTASVIQGALENIAVEMGYKLMRMSYSSIIRESEDFGAGLVDAKGRGLSESAQDAFYADNFIDLMGEGLAADLRRPE